MKRIHWLQRVFALTAVAWGAVIPAAAWHASHVTSRPLQAVGALVYAAGAVVCHQRPERSFHVWTSPFPVCARCTGIYLAAAITAMAFASMPTAGDSDSTASDRSDGGSVARAASSAAGVRWLAVCALIPSALTIVWEWTTGTTPSNAVRAAAGLPIGAFVSWLMLRVDDRTVRNVGRARHSE